MQKKELIPWALFLAFFLTFRMGGSPLIVVALALAGSTLWAGRTWLRSLRAARGTEDLPTATIRGAAQGYVELIGFARPLDSGSLTSPGGNSCVWWTRTQTTRKGHKEYHTEHSTSSRLFYVEDATGRCLVDPHGAEVSTHHRQSWLKGGESAEERFLPGGTRLHVLGRLETFRTAPSVSARMQAIFGSWLADPKRRAVLDVSGDGKLDENEFAAARQAAATQARRETGTEVGQSDVIRMPRDGRPFILSTTIGQRRADTSRVHATASLIWFAASGVLLVWVLARLLGR